MKNSEIDDFKNRFAELEEQDDNMDINEYEEKILQLEKEITEAAEFARGVQINSLKKLSQQIVSLKKEKDFYDEDGERSMMFPDGEDDD